MMNKPIQGLQLALLILLFATNQAFAGPVLLAIDVDNRQPITTAKPGAGIATPHKDVDYGPFMANISRRIKINWTPIQGSEKKRTVVLFNVDKDGTLVNEQIGESSGDKDVDARALSAVRKSAPFRKLPEAAGSDVRIKYTFDFDVYQGSLGGASLISPL